MQQMVPHYLEEEESVFQSLTVSILNMGYKKVNKLAMFPKAFKHRAITTYRNEILLYDKQLQPRERQ